MKLKIIKWIWPESLHEIKSFDHLEEFQGVFSVRQNTSMIANIKKNKICQEINYELKGNWGKQI